MRHRVSALRTRVAAEFQWQQPQITWPSEERYTCIVISNNANQVNFDPWTDMRLEYILGLHTNRDLFSLSHRPRPRNVANTDSDVEGIIYLIEEIINIIQTQNTEHTLVASDNTALLTILSVFLQPFSISGCSSSMESAFHHIDTLKNEGFVHRKNAIEQARDKLYDKYLGILRPTYRSL